MSRRKDFTQQRSALSAAQQERLERRCARRRAWRGRQCIPRRPEGQAASLSFGQEQLWVLDQLQPGSPAYHRSVHLLLTGPVHVPILERCLAEIVRRHEILRTTFPSVDGRPVQAIAVEMPLPLPLIDLGGCPESERWTRAKRLAGEELDQPFDLARGPLVRARLLRLDQKQHVLLLMLHHIVFDGWSEGILHRELAALYVALAAGRPSPLAPVPIHYADFATWHAPTPAGRNVEVRGRLLAAAAGRDGNDSRHAHRLFWPGPTQSPGRCGSLSLGRELSVRLAQLGRPEGATLFMMLLAAFQPLLGRYSGQEDLAVGCPVAGRSRPELEGLIGFFVNTLVLRADLSGNPTFRELLRRVREDCLGAYAHQELPFAKLVEELRPERSSTRTPFFRVMFQLAIFPHKSAQQGEVGFAPFET